MAYYRFNKETKTWSEIPHDEKQEHDIKLEARLVNVLDQVKKDLHKDRDIAIIIFGAVGSGKSTLGRLCCRYVADENFKPRDHIVRDVKDIATVMRNAKKYEGVVFDEASGIFGSADTNTKKTKYAQLVLDVCRQKNLFLVIIAPQFHRLTAPVALDRTTFALRTFFHKKNNQRGKFCFYGTKSKAILYEYSKKFHGKINIPRLKKWHGEFGEDMLFDEEYRKLKDETLNLVLDSFEKPKTKQKTPADIELAYRKKMVMNNLDMPTMQLAKLLDISERQIQKYRKEVREKLREKALIEKVISEDKPKMLLLS